MPCRIDGRGLLGGHAVGHRHRLAERHRDPLGVAAGRGRPGDAVALGELARASSTVPAPSAPTISGSGARPYTAPRPSRS